MEEAQIPKRQPEYEISGPYDCRWWQCAFVKAAQETESQQQSFFLVNKKKIDAERKESPQYYAILVAIKTIPEREIEKTARDAREKLQTLGVWCKSPLRSNRQTRRPVMAKDRGRGGRETRSYRT
jgi:hypothetical protein